MSDIKAIFCRLESQNAEHDAQSARLNVQITDLKYQIAECNTKISERDTQIAEIRVIYTNENVCRNLHCEFQEINSESTSCYRCEHPEFCACHNNLTKELNGHKEYSSALNGEIAQLNAQIDKLITNIAELNAEGDTQIADLNAQIAGHVIQIAEFISSIVKLNSTITQQRAKIAELNAKNAELNAKIAQQRDQIDPLIVIINQQNDKIDDRDNNIRQLNFANFTIKELNEKNQSLMLMATVYSKEFDKLNNIVHFLIILISIFLGIIVYLSYK
jgi:phage shock protein A